MNDFHSLYHDPFHAPLSRHSGEPSAREDWEDWDSEGEKHSNHNTDDGHHGNATLLIPQASSPTSIRKVRKASLASTSSRRVDSRPSTLTSTSTNSRYFVQKPLRLKSRARQKAQNANAGIRLVTDMSKFRKQQQQQQRQQLQPAETTRVKFVDAAALRALEGKPSDSSVGSWHWLKRRANGSGSSPQQDSSKGGRSRANTGQDLSPNDRPIVIGISLPEDDLGGRTISPNTAAIETPIDLDQYLARNAALQNQFQLQQQQLQQQQPIALSPRVQPQSAWSPDTEDGSLHSSSIYAPRTASSIYSQPGFGVLATADAPPVPAVPAAYTGTTAASEPTSLPTATGSSQTTKNSSAYDDDDDDDNGTPITLFEEDGSPVSQKKPSQATGHARLTAMTNGTTQSGWWDHIRTPFIEHPPSPLSAKAVSPMTPSTARSPLSASSAVVGEAIPAVPAVPLVMDIATTRSAAVAEPTQNQNDEWWKTMGDEKKDRNATPPPLSNRRALGISTSVANAHMVRSSDHSPTVASSSRAAPTQRIATPRSTPRAASSSDKAAVLLTAANGAQAEASPRDVPPPPYEPPSRPEMVVRYRAVFPAGHPLRANFPPSPGPISPGLVQTMTSQGAIHMSDVPLTPPGVRGAAAASGTPLPHRPNGVFMPGTMSSSPLPRMAGVSKAEQTRRRHEKEDVVTRRAGTLWRGRGCLPGSGCFGRRGGREGRKRRRVWLSVCGGLLLVVVLITVLAVTLTRKRKSSPPYSFWLNVTDFPPVPTGVTTVIGTDNVKTVSGCVAPSTLWSCSLPKEQAGTNLPFAADQPSFFIDIQFDNSSQKVWNVPDGVVPTPTPVSTATTLTTSATTTATATQTFAAGVTPQPAPPSFQEMWFLGNTTDSIRSDRKAGEPTPFYITFLSSLNASTAGPNVVGDASQQRRDGIPTSKFPPPVTNANGTGAPAVMHPLPVQQPLRLYDRGLPTEHLGFYSYFSKSIYVRSIAADASDTADSDGGSLETEAAYVVTWAQARFLVQIWTRMGNSTRMMGSSSSSSSGSKQSNTTQPGTFPYPITVTEDLHGGDFAQKGEFARVVDGQQRIQLENATAILANLQFSGTLINHGTNPSYGGFDGGTGGCKCAWANFVGVNGNTAT